MFGGAYFAGALFAGVTGAIGPLPAVETGAGIVIGGIEVSGRVRVDGLTIHDILNDAPNTATFVLDGEAPAVGQRVQITVGPRALFTGSIQTIDQAFESIPAHLAWQVTAIDDTQAANRRRPFGTFVQTSATTIAQTLTSQYAAGFSSSGIAPGLPAVSIVFDGADTFIACLSRLATAIGGYCKVDDRIVYLFLEDPGVPPAPIDPTHKFLMYPPVQMTTDSSQIRTRVYGKGYSEAILADVAAGETLLPIRDGANFPPLGGRAIASVTADGAQSEQITFSSISRPTGGTLVGPGAAPANAPAVGLGAGGVVTNGVHGVGVVFVTPNGPSLMGPAASINVNPLSPPAAAVVPSPPVNGTGPDSGSHDYVTTFTMLGGETTPGPASASVTTSAASGQLPSPSNAPQPQPALLGSGAPAGTFDYQVTFTGAGGETTPSLTSPSVTAGPSAPVQPNGVSGSAPGKTVADGQMATDTTYTYYYTFTTAVGETTAAGGLTIQLTGGQNACDVQLMVHPDPRVTGRKLYRLQGSGSSASAHLCATIGNNSSSTPFFEDKQAFATIAANPFPPGTDTTAQHQGQIPITQIATGPAGTTGRKLYRRWQQTDSQNWYLVASFNNNTATTYTDTAPHNATAPTVPTSNTTGTAVQQVPLTAIPVGPAGTSGRNLYRRFNGAGTYKLVTAIANNTATTYTDSKANSALGAVPPATNTATGNTVSLLDIPRGASTVVSRQVYMTLAGTTNYRLALTVPDNTTTTGTISVADATLSGNAAPPTVDTSGLQQPQGQVNPGSPTLIVASAAPFAAGGGWVITGGGQVVRYTGISGQSLTGVPVSGPGAIVTTILYGQQATPSPTMVGVSGLTRALFKGATVALWVQRDDLQAQAEQAARTGGDGIVEFLIVDGRRGLESLTARCDADLALFSRPIITVRYATRDLATKSGQTVTINLPSQGIAQVLTIQEVTITEIGIVKHLPPRFTVEASSVRFTLEDTLRRMMAIGPVSVN